DLIRSFTSATGKDRSTRASPSTDPSLWKYPTPDEYSTTCPIPSCAFLGPSWPFSAVCAGRATEEGVRYSSQPVQASNAAQAAVNTVRRMTGSFQRGLRVGRIIPDGGAPVHGRTTTRPAATRSRPPSRFRGARRVAEEGCLSRFLRPPGRLCRVIV